MQTDVNGQKPDTTQKPDVIFFTWFFRSTIYTTSFHSLVSDQLITPLQLDFESSISSNLRNLCNKEKEMRNSELEFGQSSRSCS